MFTDSYGTSAVGWIVNDLTFIAQVERVEHDGGVEIWTQNTTPPEDPVLQFIGSRVSFNIYGEYVMQNGSGTKTYVAGNVINNFEPELDKIELYYA